MITACIAGLSSIFCGLGQLIGWGLVGTVAASVPVAAVAARGARKSMEDDHLTYIKERVALAYRKTPHISAPRVAKPTLITIDFQDNQLLLEAAGRTTPGRLCNGSTTSYADGRLTLARLQERTPRRLPSPIRT